MKTISPRRRAWMYICCATVYGALATLYLYEAIVEGERTRTNEISLVIAVLALMVMLVAAHAYWKRSR